MLKNISKKKMVMSPLFFNTVTPLHWRMSSRTFNKDSSTFSDIAIGAAN